MRAPVVVAAALAAGLLVGCSAPTDVTGIAGSTAPTAPSSAVPNATAIDPDLLAALPPCPATTAQPPVADGLPDIALACLGPGDPVALSGLRGRPLIINTWASWCQPCRSELPALASFWRQHQQEVDVLGLNVSDDPAAAAALWEQLGVGFPSVTDPEAATRPALAWVGLPVTYFVDADGVVVGRHAGAVTDVEQWQSLASEQLDLP